MNTDGYCFCGCGGQTTLYRKKYKRFIAGHQARGANNSRFGAVLSPEIRAKISVSNTGKHVGEKNQFFGKTHSDSSKQKMSEAKIGIAYTPRRGVNLQCLICSEFYYVPQYKKNISKYCSIKCRDIAYCERYKGENNPFFGKEHSLETKETLRKSTLQSRSRGIFIPTRPEKTLHVELHKLGILFETEVVINEKFCVDVLIPNHKLIIYVDGCYWHACPIHCPTARKYRSDNARIPYLTKCGYNVEIIWEHDIKSKAFPSIIVELCKKYNIKTN